MLDPNVSAPIQDASVDTAMVQTLLVVGQSNDATVGLHQDLEFSTLAQIDSAFGADSHIAAGLRDVITMYADSIVKPKLWAVSYEDDDANTARVLESTITGTATKDCVVKIKINSLNPDRTSAQAGAVAALRMTKSAYCGDYTIGNEEVGSPNLASNNFTPILAKATSNDVIIEANISKSFTATQIASAINAAINASARCVYSSTASSGVITLTAKHKGAISNMFSFEVIPASIKNAGFAIETLEDTAGAGVVDATGILNLTNEYGQKLEELEFNLVSIPYAYSSTALVNDSYSKFENVLAYANRCLEYMIFKGIAVDTASNSDINDVADANPLEDKGVVKCVLVSKLDGIAIRGVSSYNESAYIKNKHLSPIQYDKLGINIGATSTLADSQVFHPISGFFSASMARKYVVEKRIKTDFFEKSFTFGSSTKVSMYSKELVLALFEFYYDVLSGLKLDPTYGNDYNGIIDNSDKAKQNFLDALNLKFAFDKASGQVSSKGIYETVAPIKGILYPQAFK